MHITYAVQIVVTQIVHVQTKSQQKQTHEYNRKFNQFITHRNTCKILKLGRTKMFR